jgi:hypothetical protein
VKSERLLTLRQGPRPVWPEVLRSLRAGDVVLLDAVLGEQSERVQVRLTEVRGPLLAGVVEDAGVELAPGDVVNFAAEETFAVERFGSEGTT